MPPSRCCTVLRLVSTLTAPMATIEPDSGASVSQANMRRQRRARSRSAPSQTAERAMRCHAWPGPGRSMGCQRRRPWVAAFISVRLQPERVPCDRGNAAGRWPAAARSGASGALSWRTPMRSTMPSRITMMRSARLRICVRCVITHHGRAALAQLGRSARASACSPSCRGTRSARRAPRAAGCRTSARASPTRWRCPPDSQRPPSPTWRVVALGAGARSARAPARAARPR